MGHAGGRRPTAGRRALDRGAGPRLRPGDSVTFYTDGLTEAPGRDGEFGARRLGLLVASCAGLSADATAGRLKDEILAYQGGTSRDDLAVLVLRRQARPARLNHPG